MKQEGFWFSFSKGLFRSCAAEIIHSQRWLGRPCALHLVYILLYLKLAQLSADFIASTNSTVCTRRQLKGSRNVVWAQQHMKLPLTPPTLVLATIHKCVCLEKKERFQRNVCKWMPGMIIGLHGNRGVCIVCTSYQGPSLRKSLDHHNVQTSVHNC